MAAVENTGKSNKGSTGTKGKGIAPAPQKRQKATAKAELPDHLEDAEPALPELHVVIRTYLESIWNIFQTTQVVLPHLATWQRNEIEKTRRKIEAFVDEDPHEGLEIIFDNARDFVEFSAAMAKQHRLLEDNSVPLLARSLFMQGFCVFDAFIGRLLKQIYLKNFELLKGISREITLVDLLEFSDIESASRAMLEKEIDSFRRDSYIEQFSQLEKKFGLPLRKFDEWPLFVEFSQRRNLLAHNDGVVNEQYISVCTRESCKIDPTIRPGHQLGVSPADLAGMLRVMSKVGFMLCHTLWMKVFPAEAADVHESINALLYQALEDKRWRTASDFGEFSLTAPMKKDLSELDYRVRLINTAIAKKFSDKDDAARDILASVDWTASYRDFKLALLVLQEDYDQAIDLMREIGRSGEMLDQAAYHAWPLFEKFRQREDFYSTYQEIYGEPYSEEASERAGGKIAATVRQPSKRRPANKAPRARPPKGDGGN
ncbi:hypothetical protein [Luteimonas kalidii]|uniref:HEPN AbiU2-like domain-containing protein n=1 Tax=Luteimonas kalidii TaxID=3042025 RepID=A0ABT6JXQ8_9GAMM|nr:hypothetical protein [Luteimonas kalidii]MDH5835273.1 hypothetical protein [Luteimonas kalidii]